MSRPERTGARTATGNAHRRFQSLGPFIAVFSLLATLWAVVLVFAVVQERRMGEGALQQLRLINNAVSQQTRGLLQGVDNNLRVLDLWVAAHPDTEPQQDAGLEELVVRLNQGAHGLVRFGLASDAGHELALQSAAPPAATTPVTWATGDGIGNSNQALHYGQPQRAAVDRPWLWPISRRFARPVHGLAGAVAWVDLARLSELNENLREKPAGAITLMTTSGTLLTRTPYSPNSIGRDFSQQRLSMVTPASGPLGHFSHDGTLTGGGPRLATYERLDSYPVTVTVSQEVDDVMAAFYSRRNTGIGVLVLLTVAGAVFSVLLSRSQRATRRSQAEFAALSDAFPLGIFCTDTQGETIYANDAYLRQLGLPRERLAWGWSELVDESQREKKRKAWQTAATEGLAVRNLLTVQRPCGKESVLSVNSAPLWVDGKLMGQVGALQDITERIRQQRAERMLTAIFQKSTDVVAQVDGQGRLMYLNPAGRALLAMTPDEPLVNLRFDDFMPAHRETQVRDEILPTALANGIWVGETSVLATGGREVHVSEMLIVHRDETQQVETYSVVMRDITRELQARTELQRSQSILNIVAATLPAIVAVVDLKQRYLFTNDAFDRSVGRPYDHLVGLTAREVLGEADYALREPYIVAALAGQRVMFETVRDGSQFFETTYIPFNGAGSRVGGLVALSQDITAHKRQQQKLLDASQTDVLTGTLNRAGFDQRMREALERSEREQHLLALLCVDLDSFKPVNDQHGHAAGDALLEAVAQRLQHALRPSDVLARLGGDEFAVVLADVKDEPAAQTVARKIVSALATPFEIHGKVMNIGGSVGVALTASGHDTVQTLMQRADAALYQAKRAGRGRFEMAAAEVAI